MDNLTLICNEEVFDKYKSEYGVREDEIVGFKNKYPFYIDDAILDTLEGTYSFPIYYKEDMQKLINDMEIV